jgi:hypothetical protein
MSKLTDYEQKSLEMLGESLHKGKWSNDGLVQLIELAGSYLNAKPISTYAAENGISYNGAKKFRRVIEIMNVKYVIDND